MGVRMLKCESSTAAHRAKVPSMLGSTWSKWNNETIASNNGQIILAPQSCVNAWPDRYCRALLIGSGSTVSPHDIITVRLTGENFPAYRTASVSIPSSSAKIADIRQPVAGSADLVLLLKNNLNLNMSQLATIFGVARRSIYNWLEGAFPRPDRYKRLSVLAGIASDYHLPHTRECAVLLQSELQPNLLSVIDALTVEEPNIEAVKQALTLLEEKLYSGRKESIASRLKARKYTELSRENREATLATFVRTTTGSSDD